MAYAEFLDPDKEKVKVEAWWEENGTVHRSVLRNKPSVGGGEFETLRYLSTNKDGNATDDDHGEASTDHNILITESIFHPSESSIANGKFKPAHVRWEYTRVS